MNKLITKSTFLTTTVCPRQGWFAHHEQLPVDDAIDAKFRRLEGIEITELARKLYRSGILIGGTMQDAIAKTSTIISKNAILFEPAFSADGFGTRADILCKNEKGCHLLEVKSGKSVKKDYIEDAAYTAMVLTRAGLKINDMSLILVSEKYRKGVPNNKMFVKKDITEEAKEKVAEFNELADSLVVTLNKPKPPEQKLIFSCKKCPIFDTCTGKDIENHIFNLPRILEKQFKQLDEKGIYRIEDITPEIIKLTPQQFQARQAVCNNEPFILPDLKKELKAIVWPAWYLDFESCMSALPLYYGIAPYETIVTQYSIHKCSAPGVEEAHFEYLADPKHDCRKEIAEKLIETLTGEGSIIVYSSYEQGIVNGLAEMFPDIAMPLINIVDRMVDLCSILKKNYSHKDFKGSYSIKKVLPVMVPGLDYSDLEIKDGGSALVLFAEMAKGKISDANEIAQIRKNLLAYCKRDTWAMVKLHEVLTKLEI